MNKQFVTYLSNKLKTSNLRNIHLNALPGRYITRLDLTQLDLLSGLDGEQRIFDSNKEKASDDFLWNNLLSKPKFQFKINFDDIPFSTLTADNQKKYENLGKHLNAIYNQNEDNFLEHGIRTFGFGYPLLVKRSKIDPTKVIKAPIFIWSLDLHRSNSAKNQWIIEKNPDAPIYVNDVLLAHINAEENINLEEEPIALPENNLIEQAELGTLLSQLLSKFSYEMGNLTPAVDSCWNKTNLDKDASQVPQILWAGVFGMYRTQKQSIIKDTQALIAKIDEMDFGNLGLKMPKLSHNSSVDADPSQEEILRTIDDREFKVIQGPPGTGKSQSLTAIITNTLENKGKVLVVCEKKTALNVIFENLQKLGLENLVAMIDDVDRDRKKIVSTVREITDTVKPKHQRFNEKNYLAKLKAYNKLVSDFNLRHQNLLKNTFRDYNLKEIIADFLRYKRAAPVHEILFEEVQFELSEREFDNLNRFVEQGSELFGEVEPAAYIFDKLATRLFDGLNYSIKNERAMFDRIKQEKQFLLDIEVEKLPSTDEPFDIQPFPDILKTEFNFDFFKNTVQQVEKALDFWQIRYNLLLKLNQHIEHTSIIRPNGFFMKVKRLSIFYQKIFTHIKALTELKESLAKLQKIVQTLPEAETTKPLKYATSSKAMGLFSGKHKIINEFWQQAPAMTLSANKIMQKSSFQKVEKELFEEEKQTVPRIDDIHYITKQLDECVKNKEVFKEYFAWRTFYDSTSELVQKCLTILRGAAKAEDWEAVFKYNYLYLLIDQESARLEHFNTNNKNLDKIIETQTELKKQHRRKILKLWEATQLDSIRIFNRESNIKWLFNHRKNSKYSRKNSLRNILHEQFELFTNIFPVVLVNPVVSSSILPLQANLFDVVLFDEASQLRLEDTYPSLLRGRIKIISGDKQQMPPAYYFSNDVSIDPLETNEDFIDEESLIDKGNPLYLAESESLLEFGNNLNPNSVHISHLDFHYRSHHPDLINFSNAAFYGSRLISLPEKSSYKALRFFSLNGVFNSNTGVNLIEAQRVIDYLKNEYPVNEDGTYPTLGIATFTMQQRNLLKDMIHELSIQDIPFRQKMNKIGEVDNWFVKNLENIQGDERDMMIISTTFGVTTEGEFKQNFGLISGKKGYRLLNVIITRAKQQVCVFSSIPEVHFTKYTSDILEKGNRGKAILYAYLDYAKAIENQDNESRKNILDLLKDACDEDGLKMHEIPNETPFEDEIYNYLCDYIRPDRIVQQYQMGGYYIDFVILNDEKQPCIALECDGAAWHSTSQAFAYDIHRQRILESQGLKVFRIWAKAWYPKPQKELEKLVEMVKEFCKGALKK